MGFSLILFGACFLALRHRVAGMLTEVTDMEGCGPDATVCRVKWVLDRELTMMLYGHSEYTAVMTTTLYISYRKMFL